MEKQLINYLEGLKGDIFKLLPMREDQLEGVDNHLVVYMDALLVNLQGAIETYPILGKEKEFLYVINNIRYLKSHKVELSKWRRIILNSTSNINSLSSFYKEVYHELL